MLVVKFAQLGESPRASIERPWQAFGARLSYLSILPYMHTPSFTIIRCEAAISTVLEANVSWTGTRAIALPESEGFKLGIMDVCGCSL